MNSSANQRPHPLVFAMTAALIFSVIGCIARVDGLGSRLYWADEVVTSLRVAGYTMDDIKQNLFDGHKHSIAEIQAYQTPQAHATAKNIIRSLALEDAQHPPLYYLAERAWVGAFGNAIATRRSLSTVFSIAALPAFYWLALELFSSPLVACIALVFAALSPLFEIYARQAREYSLWELLAICSAASIVRATRLEGNGLWWGISCLSLVATAYTFLFGIFSTLSAWAYVAACERFRFARRLRSATLVALTVCVCFAPWVYEIIAHRARIAEANAWSSVSWPLPYLLAKIVLNIVSPFYDLPLLNIRTTVAAIPLFVILAASIWYFFAKAPRHARVFIASLVLPTVLFVIVPDILTHAHRSSVTRYLFLIYIGLQLVMAYFIAALLQTQRWLLSGSLIAVIVVLLEINATVLQMRADIWWDNQSAWPVPQIATQVHYHPNTIVDTSDWPTLLELLPYLDPATFTLLGDVSSKTLHSNFYLLSPSDALLTQASNAGFTLRALRMNSPLQHSAHTVGAAAVANNTNHVINDQATLFLIVKHK